MELGVIGVGTVYVGQYEVKIVSLILKQFRLLEVGKQLIEDSQGFQNVVGIACNISGTLDGLKYKVIICDAEHVVIVNGGFFAFGYVLWLSLPQWGVH